MAFATDGGTGVHLSTQQFAEVVEALRVEAAVSKGHERRLATRIEVHTTVQVAEFRNGVPAGDVTVLTRDISIGGIGIIQTRPLEPNEQLLVRLPRLSRTPLVMLARATFCRRLADNIYNIGLAFIREFEIKAVDPQAHRAELRQIQQRILS